MAAGSTNKLFLIKLIIICIQKGNQAESVSIGINANVKHCNKRCEKKHMRCRYCEYKIYIVYVTSHNCSELEYS